MAVSRKPTSPGVAAVSAAILLAVTATACGRSSSKPPTGGGSTAAASTSASASAAAAGGFGSLAKVCAPGPGTGGSGRGISGKTIRIGVLADPGAAAAPGLGQEFFDVADGFSKWCNAAGGINGRTVVVDKLDAKLFNGAASVTTACQSDFMLVGGTTALDAPTVKPREACKLGTIPAYTASPEAYDGNLQVNPGGSPATIYPVAPLRLLADAYPTSKQGLGIAGSSLASLRPQGLRAAEAWQKLGYKVASLQARPALVPNFRPYLTQLKQAGAQADFEIVSTDASPIFQAMSDTGFKPQWVLFGQQFYNDAAVSAAKAVPSFPNTYTDIAHLPFDLAGKYPVMQQLKDIMAAVTTKAGLTDFTILAFQAWLLWAKSATECGTDLTQDCVLQKAGATTNWDAGGIAAPVAGPLSAPHISDCWLLERLTTSGWVYDQKVTQPTKGPWNCGSQNLVTVKSYLGS